MGRTSVLGFFMRVLALIAFAFIFAIAIIQFWWLAISAVLLWYIGAKIIDKRNERAEKIKKYANP